MLLFFTTISNLAISQLLLTGLFYFCFFRKSQLGLLVPLLCTCFIAVSMLGLVNPEFVILNFVTGRVAAATPAVLWIFAHALFIDDRKITPLAWFFLISYQIARGYVTYIDLTPNGVPQNLFISALNALALLVALGLTVHVIIMATREFSIDLLEERRRIRGPFAAGLGIIMAMLVASILLPLVVSQEAAQAL